MPPRQRQVKHLMKTREAAAARKKQKLEEKENEEIVEDTEEEQMWRHEYIFPEDAECACGKKPGECPECDEEPVDAPGACGVCSVPGCGGGSDCEQVRQTLARMEELLHGDKFPAFREMIYRQLQNQKARAADERATAASRRTPRLEAEKLMQEHACSRATGFRKKNALKKLAAVGERLSQDPLQMFERAGAAEDEAVRTHAQQKTCP